MKYKTSTVQTSEQFFDFVLAYFSFYVTTSNGSVSADRQQSLQSSFVRMSRLKECQQVLVLHIV